MGTIGDGDVPTPERHQNGNRFHDDTCSSLSVTATGCGLLPGIANAEEIRYPSNSTDNGSLALYECFSGYALQGNEERICQEDGQWSGTQPFCQGMGAQVQKR